MRRFAGLALALAAAGCGTAAGLPETTQSLRSISSQDAFVLPPPGGPSIVGVIEQRYSNGVTQEIALSTSSHVPGQNSISVRLVGPVGFAAGGPSSLSDRPLSPIAVYSDMRRALPGVRMSSSPYYVQNRYGPFGYAVGRAATGDLCLYAWQRIQASGQATIIRNQGSISIRLRLCDARLSEQRLLSVMYGITINAFFRGLAWNPYGQPPGVPDSMGGLSAPTYPADGQGFRDVSSAPPSQPAVRRAAAPRRSSARAEPVVETLPTPVGPVVPVPPGGTRSAAPPAQGAAVPVPSVVVPPPPCTGRGTGGVACN